MSLDAPKMRPEASTADGTSSDGDTIDDSRMVLADVDENASTPGVPTRTETPSSAKGTKRSRPAAKRPRPKKGGAHVFVNEGAEGTEDESAPKKIKRSGSEESEAKVAGTAVGFRRQANGTVGSVYSGSKIRHLKKKDGIPLWRIDIQYAFLKEVVHDEKKCFTRYSDGKKDCTFAEIYVDCMAKSSKTSKILKDRLHVDIPAALNMAMICLLVNVGRMNTTLNFFPEMRAALRTYHSIPALQAYPTQKDYKPLQDAPRLKSILKGASEDEEQPKTLPQLRALPAGKRSNAVNLIFVLSQAANEISQLHFLDKIDFFDLAIRSTVTSHTRARAFLWLMWWYLESDFTKEDGLNNPFGPGEYKEGQDPEKAEDVPQLVPKLEHITDDEGLAENVDTQEEMDFGEEMRKERIRFNEEKAKEEPESKEAEHKGIKKLKRSARDLGDEMDSSDVDSRASPGASARSPAPIDLPGHNATSILQADSLDDDWEAVENHPGRGRYKRPKGTPSRNKQRLGEAGSLRGVGRSRLGINSDRGTPDTGRGTPQPPGINHPILSYTTLPATTRAEPVFENPQMSMIGMPSASKSRARTGYQRELEQHKQRRVDWLITKKLNDARMQQKAQREAGQPSWLLQDMYRISQLPDMYDSEEDESAAIGLALLPNIPPRNGTGLGGLLPVRRTNAGATNMQDAPDDGTGHFKNERDENAPPRLEPAGLRGNGEDEDAHGAEANDWVRAFRRTQRRLFTWTADKDCATFVAQKLHEREGKVPPAEAPTLRTRGHADSILASSIANSTPRKPGHDSKKSLDEEITQDILFERSADEDEEDQDEDGDVTMQPVGVS